MHLITSNATPNLRNLVSAASKPVPPNGPSKTGNPSGPNRGNNPPKPVVKPAGPKK